MFSKILIIGADGQLGSDLRKVFSRDLLCPAILELDVTNFEQTGGYILNNRPELVINTAAFHQVDDCEKDPQKAFLVNASAVKNLAGACAKSDATLVHISTDYVFGLDKNRNNPYTENDLPGPVNAYGSSKLSGEYFVRSLLDKHFIIRPSALFGTAGAKEKGGNFVETMIRLAREKKEIRVKDDEFTTPTYTLELAQNIAELAKTNHYGLYHCTGEGQCSWFEFAKMIFELSGIEASCRPAASGQFAAAAQRPRYSVLENANLKQLGLNKMSAWPHALKKYLIEKGHISA